MQKCFSHILILNYYVFSSHFQLNTNSQMHFSLDGITSMRRIALNEHRKVFLAFTSMRAKEFFLQPLRISRHRTGKTFYVLSVSFFIRNCFYGCFRIFFGFARFVERYTNNLPVAKQFPPQRQYDTFLATDFICI